MKFTGAFVVLRLGMWIAIGFFFSSAASLAQILLVDPPNFSQKTYAHIAIDQLDHFQLTQLKLNEAIDWWVEADQTLLVVGNRLSIAGLQRYYKVKLLHAPVDESALQVIAMDHFRGLESLDAWIILEGGRFTVVQARAPLPDFFFHDAQAHAHRLKHTPLKPNTVLASQWRPQVNKRRMTPDPLIQSLVNKVDTRSWLTDVYCLAAYNRFTRGSDIRNAEHWLVDQFEALPGLEVRTESFLVNGDEAFNVIAELPGDGTTDDIFIIGAHYDSISENSTISAPGAEDNASGTAAVLELARIFVQSPPSARLIFTCYSGEEQGLHGSRNQVSRLSSANLLGNIRAALIMDMIGYTADSDLDSLLETSQTWSDLATTFADAASTYTQLRPVTSFNPFGSDHIPFLQNSVPALLLIENDWNIYPGYHRSTDLPTEISYDMGKENLKLMVATLAKLAGFKFSGHVGDYFVQWLQKPSPPTTLDLTGNNRIDIGELILIANQTP